MSNLIPKAITFQPDIYPKVLDLIPSDFKGRMLDLGAGQGYFSQLLKARGFDVTACDFLADNFKVGDIPFVKADLNKEVPLEDNSFDCVVSIEVIEHIENHFQFMRELVRVTKPGGLIIVTTPNILSVSSRINFFLYGYTDCAPFPIDPNRDDYFMEHINPIGLPELIFHFERSGADLIELSTNRYRKGSLVAWFLFYPIFALMIRLKFLNRKRTSQRILFKRHIKWVTHRANLLGRITIAQARKRP